MQLELLNRKCRMLKIRTVSKTFSKELAKWRKQLYHLVACKRNYGLYLNISQML